MPVLQSPEGEPIQALGTLRHEGDVSLRPKPLLLLTYLGLEGPTSRSRLVELFGAGAADPADAVATTLRRARPGLVMGGDGDDRLATRLGSDALAFRERALAGDDTAALARYRGPFLEGLALSLGIELEEWCMDTREALARLAVSLHMRQACAALASGERERATRHTLLAVRHAPPEALDLRQVEALERLSERAHLPLPGRWAHPYDALQRRRRTALTRSRRHTRDATRRTRLLDDWRTLAGSMRVLVLELAGPPRRGAARGRSTSASARLRQTIQRS